jgi:LmbE family N-acetylglucosaminyl deacetylase
MKLVTLALALTLTVASAQTPQFTDPANLRGERVRPRDGRELPIDSGALGLQQLLRRLNTRASILNIVAHPDDEDGGMLTYYSRGLGARVADLSLTRGEGGQNAMTGDFEDALGLLRTQELLANDRYVGVDQMFGTEVDFGFSKTKSEAFAKWTHDRVLYDAVRAVRLYRPLVITSTWIGSVTDGHGQHQVAGQIAQEAFLKAGDPTVFPDQIAEGILPWQPLRVYARVPTQSISEKGLFDYATGQYVAPTFTNYVTGEVTTTPPTTDVTVHEGQPDALLTTAAANPADLATTHIDTAATTPLTYIQFARIGLGLQRSQIPAGFRPPPTGTYDVPYHLYGSCPTTNFQTCHPGTELAEGEGPASASQAPKARPITAQGNALGKSPEKSPRAEGPTYSSATDPNFFTGIDISIDAIADLAPHAPPSLRTTLKSVSADFEQAQRLAQEEDMTGVTHALYESFNPLSRILSTLDDAHPVIGMDKLPETKEWTSLPSEERSILRSELRTKWREADEALALALGIKIDAIANVAASNIRSGTPLPIAVHLTTTSTEPILKGLEFVRVELVRSDNTHLIAGSHKHGSFDASSSIDDTIEVPASTLSGMDITRPYFKRSNLEEPSYELSTPALRNAPQTPYPLVVSTNLFYRLHPLRILRVVHVGQQPVSIVPPDPTTYRSIGYGDLPRTIYYPPAPKHVSLADLKLPTKRHIAYLPGTGDAVPEALASIGLPVTTLTVADLTPTKLANFDTVILGVRTYAAHPDLHGAPTQALLNFARSGGNVVVQYQTAEFTADDAPYPLTLGRDAEKVVDETAPVQLLLPAQPGTAPGGIVKATPSPTPTMEYALLNTPNVITSADFNSWVEERGHGFLSNWDPHYAALTETHDPGSPSEGVLPQAPQRGGLITTPLGKGRWTYCAFALYRQLPEAIPGAYRLFLNLINP